MNQSQKTKYVTLFYDVIQRLEISWPEYVLLEMVYHLSHRTGYCYKTASSMAADMRLTKQGINKMIRRLCEKQLLERLTDNAVRVTDKYYSLQGLTGNKVSTKLVNGNKVSTKSQKLWTTGNKVSEVETKLPDRKQSSPKNYIENNSKKAEAINRNLEKRTSPSLSAMYKAHLDRKRMEKKNQ